jgi:glycosyltransferase involved in cell wall biosynthesis
VAQKRPNARFLLAGSGSANQVKALWEFADRVGLPRERLMIEGILADLPEVMASLDIGVVASVGSEGSSRVILEYLASGCPVVATRVGGISDLVRDGHEGFLVEPRDPAGMAARLDCLIQDPALRRAMGEAGRRAALERFTPERWIGEVESLYRETTAEI